MRSRGFSLLEMLVAFTIMAMSLGLLYRAAGSSAAQAADLELRQHGAWLVESLLNTRATVEPGGWNESGDEAGYQWQILSEPYDAPPPATPSAAAPAGAAPLTPVVKLHKVHIEVRWDKGTRPGHLAVDTLLPERPPRPGEVVR